MHKISFHIPLSGIGARDFSPILCIVRQLDVWTLFMNSLLELLEASLSRGQSPAFIGVLSTYAYTSITLPLTYPLLNPYSPQRTLSKYLHLHRPPSSPRPFRSLESPISTILHLNHFLSVSLVVVVSPATTSFLI